ncbi:MAG: hypothetical protein MJZ86_06500 [Bacteroidales bacterium]|nr:hypothetical protein [Bacteroidales bacterium]
MKSTKIITMLCALTLTALAFSSCKKFQGDVTVPAYIHVDAIDIVPQEHNAPSSEPGFYTSKIDCAQLICYFEGDEKETVLGAFQLPCTAPVLRHGQMKYLRVVPVVKQDGASGTRIAYPFFQSITLNGLTLQADSVLNLGTLHANYYTRSEMNVLTEDYFEPTTFSTHFDSTVVWIDNDPENACTGRGYGLVTVDDTTKTVTFTINDQLNMGNGYLYLEMDYQTDLDLWINMWGYVLTVAGTSSMKSVMALYPNKQWNKIYINLGRTWAQFNYNTPIKIEFQAINPNGTGGHIKIDNVKILSTH